MRFAMGLDMYLTRKISTLNLNSEKSPEWEILVIKNGNLIKINSEKITSVSEEIGYWRKANSIHKWFVSNVQDNKDDCGEYYVSRDKLKDLKDVCQRVLENPELSDQLLPTSNGFFFGSTDYDSYYLDSLKSTINYCNYALSLDQDDGSFYYQSSW